MSVRQVKRRLPSGNFYECWLVDIFFRHKDGTSSRIRRTPRVQTRVGAQRLERELLWDLERGEAIPTEALGDASQAVSPSLGSPQTPTFEMFWDEFFATYVVVNNKPSEQHAKKSIFQFHLQPFFGPMKIDEIGGRDIERFKAKKMMTDQRTYSAKSINNQLAVLRTALRMAHNWGLIAKVPVYRELRLPERNTRFLSPTESSRLVAGATEPWKSMIVVALNTGLRIGELIALRWSDLDLAAERVVVRRTDWKGILGTPKGGRCREVGLNRTVLTALRAHKALGGAPAEWVFARGNGLRLTNAICRRPLHRACDSAGLMRFQWHTLRHTFASQLVAKGIPLRAVQLLLGHANHSTTERYAHFLPKMANAAVQALDLP